MNSLLERMMCEVWAILDFQCPAWRFRGGFHMDNWGRRDIGIAIISGIKSWFVEIGTRVASRQSLIVLTQKGGVALISCDNDCWPSFWQFFFVARNFGPWRGTTCKQQTIGVCRGMHVYMVARFSNDSSVSSQLSLHLLYFIYLLQSSFEHHGSSRRRLSYLQVGVPRTPRGSIYHRWKCQRCSSQSRLFQGSGGNTSLSDELIFVSYQLFSGSSRSQRTA